MYFIFPVNSDHSQMLPFPILSLISHESYFYRNFRSFMNLCWLMKSPIFLFYVLNATLRAAQMLTPHNNKNISLQYVLSFVQSVRLTVCLTYTISNVTSQSMCRIFLTFHLSSKHSYQFFFFFSLNCFHRKVKRKLIFHHFHCN